MLNMLCFFIFSLYFLGSTVAGQESVEILSLHDSSPMALQPLSHTGIIPIAVSVANEHLNQVSSSVINAETWVRTHVLPHYPSTNITTIVAGHTLLCNKHQLHYMGLVLPSMKNIRHSLTRWGLEREIKVSPSLSSNCLQNPLMFDPFIKPLLNFLQLTNSPYSVNPPPYLSTLSDENETLSLVTSHLKFIKNLGFFINNINVVITSSKETKPTSRKLSFIDPFGYSVSLPPMVVPANPPYGFDLPPCNPSGGSAPAAAPVAAAESGLWCVAKPSVPADVLQEAMDYACGEGGADCEAIGPRGGCYFPDSLVAHASYAFNSYWQKKKNSGGTCGFGGTAMLINSDPSYRHCRFILR